MPRQNARARTAAAQATELRNNIGATLHGNWLEVTTEDGVDLVQLGTVNAISWSKPGTNYYDNTPEGEGTVTIKYGPANDESEMEIEASLATYRLIRDAVVVRPLDSSRAVAD